MNSAIGGEVERDPMDPGASCKCSESEEEVRPAKKQRSEEEQLREERLVSSTASGEDLSRRDADGRSLLHHAAAFGDVDIVRELIRRGADTRLRNQFGRTPLYLALFFERDAAAQLLAEADPMNEDQDEFGRSPLHMAALAGCVRTIRQLLASGARTRVRCREGGTPLHWALVYWKEAAAELLAEADPGNDVQDEAGRSPLHLAALRAFEGAVRKMVRCGTNPHVKDRCGKYPIQEALRHRRNGNIPKMLLSMYALTGIAIDWEELQLGENDQRFCMEALSGCEAEIRLMKETKVPTSPISHHHLVTQHVCRVAPHLHIEGVRGVSRSCRVRQKFPIYADLIAPRLRAAEDRRFRVERCLECFSLLSPPLPPTCADVVLLCLSDGDMESFLRAL